MQVAAAALLFYLSSDKRQRRCFFCQTAQRQRRCFSSSGCPALDVRACLSYTCNKCALCGNFRNYNGKSIVHPVNHIKTAQGKLFFLKQNLTCSTYGIYAAQCKIFQKIYVGQAINPFSTRCFGHRAFWNNNNAKRQHQR